MDNAIEKKNSGAAREKICEQCGKPFVAKRWWARFCPPGDEGSKSCRSAFHVQRRREALHEYELYRKPVDEPAVAAAPLEARST